MKVIFTCLLIIAVSNIQAQKHRDSTGMFPYQNGKIHIIEVVQDSLTKDQLFDNASTWFAKETNDYNNIIIHKVDFGIKDNIIINDRSGGEFVGTLKSLARQNFNETLYSFDVYIYVKDGKYKYDFTNFKYLGNSLTNNMMGRNMTMDFPLEQIDRTNTKNKNIIIHIKQDVDREISDLKQSMATRSSKDF